MGNVIRFRKKLTDQEKFDLLVRPHFEALYMSAVRLTGTEQDAEDLLQEVMMKALAWLEELERMQCPKAWLSKVMYNTLVDVTRRDGRSPTGNLQDGHREPDQLPALDDSLALVLDRQRRIDQVIRAMRHLNQEDCALIGMRDVEGFTIAELKQVTGLPEGTIKARLHRARKKLGRLLSNEAIGIPQLRVVGGTK